MSIETRELTDVKRHEFEANISSSEFFDFRSVPKLLHAVASFMQEKDITDGEFCELTIQQVNTGDDDWYFTATLYYSLIQSDTKEDNRGLLEF